MYEVQSTKYQVGDSGNRSFFFVQHSALVEYQVASIKYQEGCTKYEVQSTK
jgi:hypothetical protein